MSQIKLTALAIVSMAASLAAQSLIGSYGEVTMYAGQNAPGIGTTLYSTSSPFDTPVMDQDGYWVGRARLTQNGGSVDAKNDRAIFGGFGAANVGLLLQAGAQAPGLPAGIYLRSNTAGSSGPTANIQISPHNRLLFLSSALSDDGVTVTVLNDSAYFWGPAGNLQLLAREGDQVPFTGAGWGNGELWGPLAAISRQYNTINSGGQVVFTTTVTGGLATTANDLVLVTGTPAGLLPIIREGDNLDGNGGLAVGASSTQMSNTGQINEHGQILIDGKLGGTATTANDTYLGCWTPGIGLQFIAREGDQAPGLATGIVMTGTAGRGSNCWNDAGKVLFTSVLSDGGATVTTANDNCLFYGGVGNATKIVRESDPTGLPGGELFGLFNNTGNGSNNHDVICFESSLYDSAGGALPTNIDSAIWFGTPGNWTMVLREGDNLDSVIPYAPAAGQHWIANNPFGIGLYLNSNDQMMFSLSCSDTVSLKNVLFCYDPTFGLQVVYIADGSAILNTPAGAATLTGIMSIGGSQSNGGSCPIFFNNAGDFIGYMSSTGASTACMVRGHVGMLQGTPSSISVATGGTHAFAVHATPAHAFNFYAIVGTLSGTSPGTVIPLGPLTIPLNFDVYTGLTIDLFDTPIYPFSLWFTDANGDGAPGAAFVLPAGNLLPTGVLHHAVFGLDNNLQETFVSEPRGLELY